jgi:DNA polymerase I
MRGKKGVNVETSNSVIAFDTETALMRPGVMAPELACVTWQVHPGGQPPAILHAMDAETMFTKWLHGDDLLVGHNVAYDMCVLAARWPHLLPAIFAKYARDQVTDTKYRQMLLDIAAGEFRGKRREDQTWQAYGYSLDDCIYRVRGARLDKDTWRLRYGEFLNTPLREWPEGARIYPLEDARATLDVYLWQDASDGDLGTEYLADQFRQARAYFALQLSTVWGIRTDARAVEQFESETRSLYEELKAELQALGLVRANGSKDMKAAQAMIRAACERQGKTPVLTDGGEKGIQQVSLGKDAVEGIDDPTVQLYSKFLNVAKTISNDVPLLKAATIFPAHPSYNLAESGRTTCSGPNIQALRREVGIRECFRPRPGKLFAQADYEGLELRTSAQMCIDLLGHSELAKALNAGLDPHLQIAAIILGITYEEAVARKAEPEVKLARGAAKPANFGFVDGIGVNRYKEYAKKAYKVDVPDPYAVKAAWDSSWPEFQDFFAGCKAILSDGGLMEQLRVGRFRRSDMFTKICSSFHQGLGADAAKNAVWLVQRACYAQPASVLYGSRMVAFVHDEIILEVEDDHHAHDKAMELGRIMVEGASVYLPDVPPTLEPILMRVWSKDAKPIYDENKRLIPWEPHA